MTETEIRKYKDSIDNMTQIEMAHCIRFNPIGHIYFDTSLPLDKYFKTRFEKLGGMTPEISKQIGW